MRMLVSHDVFRERVNFVLARSGMSYAAFARKAGLDRSTLSQLLTGLLFGVEPVDPITIGVSALLLVTVALFAAWIPARTAMAVDPMMALRGD